MGGDVRAQLGALLQAREPWPGEIYHFGSLGSTNDWLKGASRQGLPEWSLVLTDSQTAGRGRHGRAWASPPGNLYLSVLLKPRLPADRVGLLPLLAGVAVAEAAGAWGIEAQLKWPNDVVVGGRKLAGILVEGVSGGADLEAVVVGVGLNLLLELGGVPEDVRLSAVSVEALAERLVSPAEAAASVLGRLRAWYDLLGPTPEAVLEAWRRLSVPWWGRPLEVRSGAEAIRGIAEGIDERGGLRLQREDGSRVVLFAGEARELRLAADMR